MRPPMPRPLLLVFSLLAALSSPPTLPAQGLLTGRTPNDTPNTTQRINPGTGLPAEAKTRRVTTQRFDSETGLPLFKPSIQPQELPTDRELGAGESAMQGPMVDEKFKPLQVFYKKRFPIQFIYGAQIGLPGEGNLSLSYRFPRGIEKKGYRHISESIYLYPTVTLGFLNALQEDSDSEGVEEIIKRHPDVTTITVGPRREDLLFGMIEGHLSWGIANLLASGFLGVGLGASDSQININYRIIKDNPNDSIMGAYSPRRLERGLVYSAGLQIESRRLMGGLRLYRTPGLDKLVAFANVGYRPDSYKEALIVAGASAVITYVAGLVYFFLIHPGS